MVEYYITHRNKSGFKLYLTTNSPSYVRWSHRRESGFKFAERWRVDQILASLKGKFKDVAFEEIPEKPSTFVPRAPAK